MDQSLSDLAAKMAAIQVDYAGNLMKKLEKMTTEMQALHISTDNVQDIDWMLKNVATPGVEKIVCNLPADKIMEYLRKVNCNIIELRSKFSAGAFQSFLLHVYKEMETMYKTDEEDSTYKRMEKMLYDFQWDFYENAPVDVNVWATALCAELPQPDEEDTRVQFYREKFVKVARYKTLPIPIIPDIVARYVPPCVPAYKIVVDPNRSTLYRTYQSNVKAEHFMSSLVAMTHSFNKEQYQVAFAYGIQLLSDENHMKSPETQRYYVHVLGMLAVTVATLCHSSKRVVRSFLRKMKTFMRTGYISDTLDELSYRQRVSSIWCNFKQERSSHNLILSLCPAMSYFSIQSFNCHSKTLFVLANSCMARAWLLKSLNLQAETNMIRAGKLAVRRLRSKTHHFLANSISPDEALTLDNQLEVLDLYDVAFDFLLGGSNFDHSEKLKISCKRLQFSYHYLKHFASFWLHRDDMDQTLNRNRLRDNWEDRREKIMANARNEDFNRLNFFSFTNFLLLQIICGASIVAEYFLRLAVDSWKRHGSVDPAMLSLAENCMLKLQCEHYSAAPAEVDSVPETDDEEDDSIDLVALIRWEPEFSKLLRFGVDTVVQNQPPPALSN